MFSLFKELPIKLQQVLIEFYGKPMEINKLNGIKVEGGCYRIRFSNHSVIVKGMANPQEYLFYTECSSYLQEFKRNIPELYWSQRDRDNYWIVIEDIPFNLPKERWQADGQVLNALYQFHVEMWQKNLPIENHYLPKWDNGLTENVLNLYPDNKGSQLEDLLFEVQSEAQQLFKPYCWINADTNPTNWGIRKDGTIVLFDWERISYGSPAIDVSITMPGLGTLDNSLEKLITKRYLEIWSKAAIDFPLSEKEFLHQIKLAKLWSIVEFIDNSWNTLDHDVLKKLLSELEKRIYKIIL